MRDKPEDSIYRYSFIKEAAEEYHHEAPPLPDFSEKDQLDNTGYSSLSLDDFFAYLPEHKYIFRIKPVPLWPLGSINSVLSKVNGLSAAIWLDRNQPIHGMSWLPGYDETVSNTIVDEGGLVEAPGKTTYNLYRPPRIELGNPQRGRELWIPHVQRVYPDDVDHIVCWLAHRVQRPWEKINHALVLGGEPRIGKDTILAPVRAAVGEWNFEEIGPDRIAGQFNGFLKCIILRINEAHDLGEVNKYTFYEKTKVISASPPETHRINEKHIKEYHIANVCGLVITTNYKLGGMYLPNNDARNYVAWSPLKEAAFTEQSRQLWDIFQDPEQAAFNHIAAFLHSVNLSGFDAKAPPPRTHAWHEMASPVSTQETAALADALEELGYPSATSIAKVRTKANADLLAFLNDRKLHTQIPFRFADCGMTPVRNPARKTDVFLWRINGVRCTIYATADMTEINRLAAVRQFIKDEGGSDSDGSAHL